MIKLLKWLLGLCDHKYEVIKETTIIDPEDRISTGTSYKCKCTLCGKLKVTTLHN